MTICIPFKPATFQGHSEAAYVDLNYFLFEYRSLHEYKWHPSFPRCSFKHPPVEGAVLRWPNMERCDSMDAGVGPCGLQTCFSISLSSVTD